jgi:hypothetical protein
MKEIEVDVVVVGTGKETLQASLQDLLRETDTGAFKPSAEAK